MSKAKISSHDNYINENINHNKLQSYTLTNKYTYRQADRHAGRQNDRQEEILMLKLKKKILIYRLGKRLFIHYCFQFDG